MPSGPSIRIAQTRAIFDHLPAWRCDSFRRGRFYLCGKCFGKRGDGPATNSAEMWVAGAPGGEIVPANARCEDCGGRAWPAD